VSPNGAYEDEMDDVALFMNALRAAVPVQPDPELGAGLVPRLAEAARGATIEADTRASRRRPRSRLGALARVGIAVAAVPLVLAGLAFAGVTVPQPARDAFHGVGIDLPNQPSADHATTSGGPESTGNEATEPKKAGGAGSGGNSAAAHRHALEQHLKAKGKALGHTRGKAIGLNESTPPGKSGETGSPAHSNAGGSSTSQSARGRVKPHVPPLSPRGHAGAHGH
jgi:hypothetical protein